jgi:hypothetical protein
VIAQHGSQTRSINSYLQNDSLLFQFILSEFLEVYRETQGLLLKRNSIHELSQGLMTLTGSPQDPLRIFPGNRQSGVLAKLKNYCSLLSQNADSTEKEPIAMQHYVDKAWLHCIEAFDLLHDTHKDKDQSTLIHTIEKTCSALRGFSRLIVRLFAQFRDDENVIFFVLRHHNQFDALYGPRFVVKLFCRLYPKGLKEAGHFLIKKYGHRGFDNLLPLVNAKISELEAIEHDDLEKTVC